MGTILDWLLKGDISIQFQVYRDLLESNNDDLSKLQKRIELEGWGFEFLNRQNKNGHWGRGFYQPKWTSTHYTLLDLMSIGLYPENSRVKKIIRIILTDTLGEDGGINYSRTVKHSDMCICGMIMGISSYFNCASLIPKSLIDFIISGIMDDGGWNCEFIHGAVHSSLHTTISVLEGLSWYKKNSGNYRIGIIDESIKNGIEFILKHRLFKSDRTGAVIDKKMIMLSFPSRWRYDILRALDYFRFEQIPYDKRMDDALKILEIKQKPDGQWPLQMKHPGQVHFEMEKPGIQSRWNTLRVLRVKKYFGIN